MHGLYLWFILRQHLILSLVTVFDWCFWLHVYKENPGNTLPILILVIVILFYGEKKYVIAVIFFLKSVYLYGLKKKKLMNGTKIDHSLPNIKQVLLVLVFSGCQVVLLIIEKTFSCICFRILVQAINPASYKKTWVARL